MMVDPPARYVAELEAWRRQLDARLRAEDGWLALAGLYWLHKGENTVGSDPTCDVVLPAYAAPPRLGVITWRAGQATLVVTSAEPVSIDGALSTAATLRADSEPGGPTQVRVGDVAFHVIRRGDALGVRVIDSRRPERLHFAGRVWFPVDPTYRVAARFTAYAAPRAITLDNTAEMTVANASVGYVEFELHGRSLRLEALDAGEGQLWLILRDQTSGRETYAAGRYLIAPVEAEGMDLDFNRCYNPPCAFTPYATCPLPPPGNILPVAIAAGERYDSSAALPSDAG